MTDVGKTRAGFKVPLPKKGRGIRVKAKTLVKAGESGI